MQGGRQQRTHGAAIGLAESANDAASGSGCGAFDREESASGWRYGSGCGAFDREASANGCSCVDAANGSGCVIASGYGCGCGCFVASCAAECESANESASDASRRTRAPCSRAPSCRQCGGWHGAAPRACGTRPLCSRSRVSNYERGSEAAGAHVPAVAASIEPHIGKDHVGLGAEDVLQVLPAHVARQVLDTSTVVAALRRTRHTHDDTHASASGPTTERRSECLVPIRRASLATSTARATRELDDDAAAVQVGVVQTMYSLLGVALVVVVLLTRARQVRIESRREIEIAQHTTKAKPYFTSTWRTWPYLLNRSWISASRVRVLILPTYTRVRDDDEDDDDMAVLLLRRRSCEREREDERQPRGVAQWRACSSLYCSTHGAMIDQWRARPLLPLPL